MCWNNYNIHKNQYLDILKKKTIKQGHLFIRRFVKGFRENREKCLTVNFL